MTYEVFGPFNLPAKVTTGSRARRDEARVFRSDADEVRAGLSGGHGCYVLSTLCRGRCLPWYIGMTQARPFSEACFAITAVRHYEAVAQDNPQANLHLTLVTRVGQEGGRDSETLLHRGDLRLLRDYLIALALNRNPALRNDGSRRHRQLATAVSVVQIPPRPGLAFRSFQDIFGLR